MTGEFKSVVSARPLEELSDELCADLSFKGSSSLIIGSFCCVGGGCCSCCRCLNYVPEEEEEEEFVVRFESCLTECFRIDDG